ncbi:MAG: hypothetical protein JSR93_01400 [Verrucomicrobia bacterium]|nr:hypothetical protein [Verrucomicrobiota bacterium]
MSHTPPVGQPGGVPIPNPSVRLTMTASPPQYIWFKGERYQVQAFQRGNGGSPDQDITNTRDWTKAGEAAMKAAEKVFQSHSKDIAEAKIVQVPLTGALSTKEGDTTDENNIKIGSSIQYARSVSTTPTESITIEADDQTKILEEIKTIGEETAKWKPVPTSTSQRPQQQSSSTTPRTDTTVQQTPSNTDSTASNPSAASEIKLPALPTLPTTTRASENALLSSFLKSQVNPGSRDCIHATCRNTSAVESLAAQINQIRPSSPPVTADSLLKGAAKHIVDNPASYRSDSDIAEMLKVLRTTYDSPNRDADRLQTRVREGAKEIKLRDYQEQNLPSILNRPEPVTLTEKEKTLVATAFANYLHNTPTTPDTDTSPNVFFKAALAFVNAPPSGLSGIGAFITSTPTQRPIHLVIATEKDENYEMHFRDPANGRLDSSQTAFILFKENPVGDTGKYSAFNRVAMTTRDPFTELPRQLASSATRPAYYPAGQLNIETGGGGNCAASALADAALQKDSKYYSSPADWHTQLESDKTQIRQRAMGYMYEHPEDFLVEVNGIDIFEQVRSGITDSLTDIRSTYPAQAQTLSTLMRKTTPYTPEEKKWLIKLYAHYSFQKDNDLDTPFFMAYAKATNTKIALIHRNTNDIFFVTPMPDKAIDASEYLFVRFETGHYQSINREVNTPAHTAPLPGSAFLDQIVTRYNASHASTIAIRGFLGSISQTDTLKDHLSNLKLKAPDAYLTLQELVGPDLLAGVLEDDQIDQFIAALTEKTNPAGNTAEALPTAVDVAFNGRTDLQARANFLSKLIEARTSRPASEAPDSQIQQELRTALSQMKDADTAGYMYFRTLIVRGDSYATILDRANMTPLFDMDLQIETNLDGTDSGTLTDPDARQKEIASRKASMLAEAGATIAEHFINEDNSAVKARAEFLQTLMKMPTDREPDGTNTSLLSSKFDAFGQNDPAGYFAYWAFVKENPDVMTGGWAPYIAKRDALLGYIMRYHDDDRITAQANVISAVRAEDEHPGQILAAVQHLQQHFSQDYLALENVFHKGALTPANMSDELKTRKTSQEVTSLQLQFASQCNDPKTAALHTFLTEFKSYKEALIDNEYAPSHTYNGAYREFSIKYPSACLAIEDMFYYRGETHQAEVNASMHAVKNIDAATIQKRIYDSEKIMNARANFLSMLKGQKDNPSPENIRKLQQAIKLLQTDDVHAFLGLVHITKKTDPAEIATELDRFPNETTLRKLVPQPGTANLSNTIYDEIPFNQAKIIQAAKTDPSTLSEDLLGTNLHAASVLACLVYEYNPPSEEPDHELSPQEKAEQGRAIIREARDRHKLFEKVEQAEYVERLLTTHMDEDALTDGPAAD